MVSRMVAEHVPDGVTMHRNVFDLLHPGGVAFHFFPTLWYPVFVANRYLPESMSSFLLTHGNDRHDPKFPAFYSGCVGPSPKARKRLEDIGYEVVEYRPFYGSGLPEAVPGGGEGGALDGPLGEPAQERAAVVLRVPHRAQAGRCEQRDPARSLDGHVPQHHDPSGPAAPGDRRGDRRRRAPVRPQGERGAGADRRHPGGVRQGGRGDRARHPPPARRAARRASSRRPRCRRCAGPRCGPASPRRRPPTAPDQRREAAQLESAVEEVGPAGEREAVAGAGQDVEGGVAQVVHVPAPVGRRRGRVELAVPEAHRHESAPRSMSGGEHLQLEVAADAVQPAAHGVDHRRRPSRRAPPGTESSSARRTGSPPARSCSRASSRVGGIGHEVGGELCRRSPRRPSPPPSRPGAAARSGPRRAPPGRRRPVRARARRRCRPCRPGRRTARRSRAAGTAPADQAEHAEPVEAEVVGQPTDVDAERAGRARRGRASCGRSRGGRPRPAARRAAGPGRRRGAGPGGSRACRARRRPVARPASPTSSAASVRPSGSVSRVVGPSTAGQRRKMAAVIPVVTPEEMAAIDRAAPEPVEVLIDRAGAAVARAALDLLGGAYGRRVVVVAGKGNNGADGRAAAARLRAPGRAGRRDRRRRPARRRCPRATCRSTPPTAPASGASTGRSGPRRGTPVLAVDIPSGVDGLTGRAAGDAAAGRPHRHLRGAQARAAPRPTGPSWPARSRVADIGLDTSSAPHPPGRGRRRRRAGCPAGRARAHKWKAAVWVVAGSPGHDRRRPPRRPGRAAGRRRLRAAVHARASTTTRGGPPRRSASPLPADGLGRRRCSTASSGSGARRRSRARDRARDRRRGPAGSSHDAPAAGRRRRRRPHRARPHRRRRARRPRAHADGPHPPRRRARPARRRRRRPRPHRRDPRRSPRGSARSCCARARPRSSPRPTAPSLLSTTGDARLATAGTGDVLTGVHRRPARPGRARRSRPRPPAPTSTAGPAP